MDFVFLDTNALAKRYLNEKGSIWLRNYVAPRQIVISELSLFEMITLLRRLQIENKFNKADAITLQTQIETESIKFEIVPIGSKSERDRLVDTAFNLPNNYRLRALDGIQLVAAQIASEDVNTLPPPNTFTFISSDRQLLQVAQFLGFTVENPENYP
jgi:predicted nucleic acid-binding protein